VELESIITQDTRCMKIAIVDDDTASIDLMKKKLVPFGYIFYWR